MGYLLPIKTTTATSDNNNTETRILPISFYDFFQSSNLIWHCINTCQSLVTTEKYNYSWVDLPSI
jgi:hypothetical protein